MKRSVRGPLTMGERRAAMGEATVRQERPPRSAGIGWPSLTHRPVEPIVSGASRRPGSSVGPSAPALPGWSAPSASRLGVAAPFSIHRGDPAGDEQRKSRRPAPWVHDAVERGPQVVDAVLKTLEEKVADPAMTPASQRPFRLPLVLLATSAATSRANGEVQPSEFSRVGERIPPTIDANLLDYFGCLCFSASTLHEPAEPKAAFSHVMSHLVMRRDLDRSIKALQGLPKIAPRMRRSPLPGPTPGALSRPRCLEGCREIVLTRL